MKAKLLNIDCMEYMKTLPDNAFDISIVDPPYGINWAAKPASSTGIRRHKKTGIDYLVKGNSYEAKKWDKQPPTQEYFDELFRVSKRQIIWGENYLDFAQKAQSPGRVVWDKVNGDLTFSNCEIAWVSFINGVRQLEYMWNGMMQGVSFLNGRVHQANKKLNEIKIHPTQKPKALYHYLLTNFCEKGWRILDTHLGSASSAIVAEKMGFEFVGCEIDEEYFEAAVARVRKECDLGLFRNGGEADEGSVGQKINTNLDAA
jgi:site-specific DNA-methyltransferase (adenine-specific)